ncbi:hypothetical protein [Streptomyces sp. 7N604]|uniref:hypothetical protein n=1 Tax=Streptomyces sp. 7N604 TaxID=3457415 RepID=UPI003FCFA024
MAMPDPVVQRTQCRENLDYPSDEPVTPLELQRRALLARYERFLHQGQGHEVTGYLITAPEWRLPVELFDVTACELVVACATLARDGRAGVWYAIGTLFDLTRFFPPATRKVLLLPARPDADLADLCTSQGVEPVWPTADAFTRT